MILFGEEKGKKLSSTRHDIKLNWELESGILTQYPIENMSRTMRFCNNQQMKKEKFSISPHTSCLLTRHTKWRLRKSPWGKFQSKSLITLLLNCHDLKNPLKILHKVSIFNKVASHFQITAKIFSESRKSTMKRELQFRTSSKITFQHVSSSFVQRGKKYKGGEEVEGKRIKRKKNYFLILFLGYLCIELKRHIKGEQKFYFVMVLNSLW